MSELISGKEALIALANGEEVEVKIRTIGKWVSICELEEYKVRDIILNPHGDEFRLKPRTITINGVEVPAPFEPKPGEYVYFISSDDVKGYAETTLIDTEVNWGFVQFGAWQTEDEIKQVVEALRSIFK